MTLQVGDKTLTKAQVGTTPILHIYIGGTLVWEPPDPMTLSVDIPDGVAGASFSATLTLGGDITYPVTITGLPSWIDDPGSIASGTDVHLTGTYPATAQTYSFTPTATDSSTTPQVATDAQSVVVSAAASGPTYLGSAKYAKYGKYSVGLAIPAAAVAGDHVLLLFVCASNYTGGAPAGATELFYYQQTCRSTAYWYTLTANDIAAGTIPVSSPAAGDGDFTAIFVAGGTAVDIYSQANVTDTTVSPISLTAPSVTPSVAGELIVAHYAGHAGNLSMSFTLPSGYTLAADNPGQHYVSQYTAYRENAGSGATSAATSSMSFTGTGVGNAFLFAIK